MLKEISLGIILICGMWATGQTAESFFPYKYNVEVLPNGLKVITIPMESNRIVAYYSITRTGSRDEWEPDIPDSPICLNI